MFKGFKGVVLIHDVATFNREREDSNPPYKMGSDTIIFHKDMCERLKEGFLV